MTTNFKDKKKTKNLKKYLWQNGLKVFSAYSEQLHWIDIANVHIYNIINKINLNFAWNKCIILCLVVIHAIFKKLMHKK